MRERERERERDYRSYVLSRSIAGFIAQFSVSSEMEISRVASTRRHKSTSDDQRRALAAIPRFLQRQDPYRCTAPLNDTGKVARDAN
jgi:hypothetical protein